MPPFVVQPRTPRPSRLTVRFIATSAAVYAAAGAIAAFAMRVVPVPPPTGQLTLPRVFWITTALLVVASAALHRAVNQVRRERQRPFRQALLVALAAGTLFVGIQTCGLKSMLANQVPEEAQTGSNAFVAMLVALHAMHLTLALLFLVWVMQSALVDRYDHEYFWGVTVCAWFWHFLGIVWFAILAVFVIAGLNPKNVLTAASGQEGRSHVQFVAD